MTQYTFVNAHDQYSTYDFITMSMLMYICFAEHVSHKPAGISR